MNDAASEQGHRTRAYILAYIGLLCLLGITCGVYHLRLGLAGTLIGFAIAFAKALLILLNFMHLRWSKAVVRVAAASGFFWLGILLVLALSDYFSRGWE